MQGSRGNIPHVPWSRHMVASPKTKSHHLDKQGTLRSIVKKQGSSSGNINCAGSVLLNESRRVQSESSLFKPELDEDNWDSQSDPGSISLTKWNRNSSKLNRKVEGDGVWGNGRQEMEMEMPSEEKLADAVDVIQFKPIPRYVHRYYDFMYYACVNPYKLWNTKEEGDMKKSEFYLGVIQKIIFGYIAIRATFSSFNFTKYSVLAFFGERDLYNFIDIGYYVVSGLFQLYIVYLIAFDKLHILRTCQIGDSYDAALTVTKGGPGAAKQQKTSELLPILNGIVTIVIAAIKTVPWHNSLENNILKQSIDTVDGLFLWTPENFKNRASIRNYYLADYSRTTLYVTGLVGFLLDLCWNLLADCFKDLIFWVAKEHEQRISVFGKEIKENLKIKSTTGESSDDEDDRCWKMYRNLLEVNTSTNKTYHILLVLNHLDTFITFSYFLTLILEESPSIPELINTGYDVLKGIIAYFPAPRASFQNETCKRWIQTLPCDTKRFRGVGGTPLTRELMLWELTEAPLGLGSGKIHINNGFLASFITLVASLFCFLLNLKKKDGAKRF